MIANQLVMFYEKQYQKKMMVGLKNLRHHTLHNLMNKGNRVG